MGRFPGNFWRLQSKAAKVAQKKRTFYCQGYNASEMPLFSGRFAWNLDIIRQSMWSSIRSETNCEICLFRGHLPQKPTIWAMFQWASCYQPADKLIICLSQNDHSVLQCAFVVWLFIHELPFWGYLMLKVPRIYSSWLCCFAQWPTKGASALQQLVLLSFKVIQFLVLSWQWNTWMRIHIGGSINGSEDCRSYFAAGFCVHCGRHRDDVNFSSLSLCWMLWDGIITWFWSRMWILVSRVICSWFFILLLVAEWQQMSCGMAI